MRANVLPSVCFLERSGLGSLCARFHTPFLFHVPCCGFDALCQSIEFFLCVSL
ncbi:hypothetical protein BJV78DRAFT_1219275, partial [Lactifluus subvellereus]